MPGSINLLLTIATAAHPPTFPPTRPQEIQPNNLKSVKQARLNLIDLAGSERQKDTNTAGSRLKEAGSINKSLSALGNVMMSLVDVAHGKERHIAYRDSKLTFLLRDSLGGNTKTSILAAVSPASKSFGESLSTLQFMHRAKMIKNKVAVNQDMEGNVGALQEEIRRLKELLADGGGGCGELFGGLGLCWFSACVYCRGGGREHGKPRCGKLIMHCAVVLRRFRMPRTLHSLQACRRRWASWARWTVLAATAAATTRQRAG